MVGVCMRSPLCAVTSEPLLSWVYLRWILLFSLRYFTNAIPDWHLTRGLVRFYNFFRISSMTNTIQHSRFRISPVHYFRCHTCAI